MTVKRGKLRWMPRWRKETIHTPNYIASFKTRFYAEINAANIYPDKRIAIISMPRTHKHRIFQLWIYP